MILPNISICNVNFTLLYMLQLSTVNLDAIILSIKCLKLNVVKNTIVQTRNYKTNDIVEYNIAMGAYIIVVNTWFTLK